MSVYENHILPRLTDLACGARPTHRQRQKIVPRAYGDVLEIGFGSGLNLPYYDRSKVRRVFALEPSAGMRRMAKNRVEAADMDIRFIDLPGEQIPLADRSVDSVLVTYTLCTIPDAVAALRGMRRVLKPGGYLFFCEHGKAPDAGVYRWQRRINPVWRRFAGGCNMDRDIPALLESSGFTVEEDNRMYIPGIRALSYNFWGSAY